MPGRCGGGQRAAERGWGAAVEAWRREDRGDAGGRGAAVRTLLLCVCATQRGSRNGEWLTIHHPALVVKATPSAQRALERRKDNNNTQRPAPNKQAVAVARRREPFERTVLDGAVRCGAVRYARVFRLRGEGGSL